MGGEGGVQQKPPPRNSIGPPELQQQRAEGRQPGAPRYRLRMPDIRTAAGRFRRPHRGIGPQANGICGGITCGAPTGVAVNKKAFWAIFSGPPSLITRFPYATTKGRVDFAPTAGFDARG